MDFAIERFNNRQYTTPGTVLINHDLHGGGGNGGVESVSVNGGDKNWPDAEGNVDLTISTGNLAEELNTNIAVGGIASGTKFEAGASVEDILKALLVKEVAPTGTLTLDPPAGVYQITADGQSVVTARLSASKNSASKIIQVLLSDGTDNREMVQSGTNYVLAVNRKYKIDTTFTAKINYVKSDGVTRDTAIVTSGYKFINPILKFKTTNVNYLEEANIDFDNLDPTFIPELVSLGTSGYKYPVNIEAGYVGIGFPDEKVIKSITDNNGFEYINAFTKTVVKVKDKAGNIIRYNFYMSPKATLTGSFAYTFK